MKSIVALAALALVATSAWAQDSRPLNLRLPADYVPPPASSTAAAPAPASSTGIAPKNGGSGSVAVTPARPHDPPGTYYGDTSGRMGGADVQDDVPRCDDATYNQPQVHGSGAESDFLVCVGKQHRKLRLPGALSSQRHRLRGGSSDGPVPIIEALNK